MILDNDAFERAKWDEKIPVSCDFCKAVLEPRMKSNLTRHQKSPLHCCGKGFCKGRMQIALGKKEPISVTNSDIVAEWHPTKNGNITPDMVTAGCGEKVWWLDVHGHEWPATVASRTSGGNGCPECLDMVKINREKKERQIASGEKLPISVTDQEVAAQWHPTKNAHLKRANGIDPLTPDWITAGCNEKVWWLDKHGHEWEAMVCDRTNNESGCPECHKNDRSKINREIIERQIAAGEKLPISVMNHELVAEWHPIKNAHLKRANGIDTLTPDWVTAGSEEYIWWLCSKDPNHEWKAPVYSRTAGQGCPKCNKYKGEVKVREILLGIGLMGLHKSEIENSSGWVFTEQYTHPELKHEGLLKCDFAIAYNGVVNGIIEYNGEHHYMPIPYGQTDQHKEKAELRFKNKQEKDQIKRVYCLANNIPLLEIHYESMEVDNKIKEKVINFLSPLRPLLNVV